MFNRSKPQFLRLASGLKPVQRVFLPFGARYFSKAVRDDVKSKRWVEVMGRVPVGSVVACRSNIGKSVNRLKWAGAISLASTSLLLFTDYQLYALPMVAILTFQYIVVGRFSVLVPFEMRHLTPEEVPEELLQPFKDETNPVATREHTLVILLRKNLLWEDTEFSRFIPFREISIECNQEMPNVVLNYPGGQHIIPTESFVPDVDSFLRLHTQLTSAPDTTAASTEDDSSNTIDIS
eukprot:gb/GEZN01013908.1/.p1 GENE.gb/GEZN01013908.1/~~gb/GEZN01013908.1/.p1  ORF type:complete len:236 (+),score=22.30 gb/GEZN01013908.1/:16-723(+)